MSRAYGLRVEGLGFGVKVEACGGCAGDLRSERKPRNSGFRVQGVGFKG